MKYFFIFMTRGKFGIYDRKTKKLSIGGVQTYMYDLAQLVYKRGYRPVIIEMNSDGYTDKYSFDNIEVWQTSFKRNYIRNSFNFIYNEFGSGDNLFLISTDNLDIKCNAKNVIAVQHGIAFDEPVFGFTKYIIKPLRIIKNIWRCVIVNNTVCVDYNYYNWFRAVYTLPKNHNVKVIPNYTSNSISRDELLSKLAKRSQRKIVFSRRFVEHRGTLIFVNAVKKLLSEYSDLDVTFAGAGPLKDFIEQQFKNDARVHMTSYASTQSIQFHSQFDISVVPTVFSEGTSLSLLEAMAAGCYPIASCVGGLSNILLDGYNGTLIIPTEDELYTSLKDVLEMPYDRFANMVTNAYNTATQGFSKKNWEEKWNAYIDNL